MGVIFKDELNGAVAAVSKSSIGSQIGVLTDSNELAIYTISSNAMVRRIGLVNVTKWYRRASIYECDLTFRSDTGNLLVIGATDAIAGQIAETSLAVMVLSQNGRRLDKQFLVAAEPPYSSPYVVDTDPPVLLVGSGSGVLCIDLRNGQVCGSLENVDEYVAPHGIVPKHSDRAQIFVMWTYQAGSRIGLYRKLEDHTFTDIYESHHLLRYFAWGAAVSEDDTKLAIALGNISAPVVEESKSAGSVSLGQMQVYKTHNHELISAFDVSGQIGRDVARQQAEILRNSAFGIDVIPASSLIPNRHISNPVFIDDNRVAFGMPSGSIRILDIATGVQRDLQIADVPITSLAFFAEPGLLCVGSANGSVYFVAVEV